MSNYADRPSWTWEDSFRELRIATACRCAADFTKRRLHEPNAVCIHSDDVKLLGTEIDQLTARNRRLEAVVAALQANKVRLAAEYHEMIAQIDALNADLLAPDQPTAIANLIALRAEEASKS